MSPVSTAEDVATTPPPMRRSALELTGAMLLLPEGSGGDVAVCELRVDYHGVALRFRPGDDLRLLPWEQVVRAEVAPWRTPSGQPGTLLTFRTARATHRLGFTGGDAGVLRPLLDEFSQPSLPLHVPRAAMRAARTSRSWRRFQPAMTLTLIALLVGAVTLVLLQSAGAIHLPILGSNTSAPGGLIAPLR